MTMNKMHVTHMLIFFFIKKIIESRILVSGMLKLWEDTDSCAKKYRHDLAIYLMAVLSSSYGIIMDREINTPGHGRNVVDILNATEKLFLKGK